MQRCGECHPQAFRAFLALQLPEQNGRSADVEFWKKVLVRSADLLLFSVPIPPCLYTHQPVTLPYLPLNMVQPLEYP